MPSRNHATGIVGIEFETDAYTEKCVGIVIKSKPLIIIVPQHAAQSIEDGVVLTTMVDGIAFSNVDVLTDAHLAGVHLTALQLVNPDRQQTWSPLPMPRKANQVLPGDSVSIQTREGDERAAKSRQGRAVSIMTDLDGSSIETDIPIEHGQSGSPILQQGRLCGIVQGQKSRSGSENVALGIPLNTGALKQLRQLQQVKWKKLAARALLILLIAALPFGLFQMMGNRSYPIEGVEVLDDRQTVTVRRNAAFPARSSWTYLVDTKVFTVEPIASSVLGSHDLIAIGSAATPDGNGYLALLSSSGKLLWTYSIPEGECIYQGNDESDWFSATHIYPSDLDLDGKNELIVAFAHMTWRPAKLMVFELDGTILAEYWHPGYVRTILSGPIGENGLPITVISASNNSLQFSWWNPQVVFAFEGLEISGQGPEPEFGNSRSSHLWYWVITNLDSDVVRAKAYGLAFIDYNGDGNTEVRASLTDGRFYYFSSAGEIVGTAAGDIYRRDYGNTPFPDLMTLEDQLNFLESLPQEAPDSSDEET